MYGLINGAMTEIYEKSLYYLIEMHDDIVGLFADLKESTKFELFSDKYDKRFLDIETTEKTLFAIAAGLAKCDLKTYLSIFDVSASMKALEQVRTDICYQNLNVKIIATNWSLSFGQCETTNRCIEDIAIMRSMSNMKVVVPADSVEAAKAIIESYDLRGPVYIRIDECLDKKLYENEEYEFKIGKGIELKEGTDITIIACGSSVHQALEAAKILEDMHQLKVRVINMHTIKPIDKDVILNAICETRRIITVEEHNVIGGLGSAVSEVIAESGKACIFKSLGISDEFFTSGLHEDLMAYYKINAKGILEEVREILRKNFDDDNDWEDEV
ncbi:MULTISPECIES: transketolase family protein [unclassified Clostridium]|uniref:transketolase family protein n=1 Tax=unclassified Clostridium TaxID=2614128 RepID=UPI0025C0274F|nr:MULTISPECIES: transketolase C-terminal domain-containing protein [unclassified Clostridium]